MSTHPNRTDYTGFILFSKILNLYKYITSFLLRIISEIDGPLDFNEILVDGSVLNVVSMDNISFFAETII